MEEKAYYIISLKHTARKDSAFTLWRPDCKGYCWYKAWAGLYLAEDFPDSPDKSSVFVETEKADLLFKEVLYDGETRIVLPNNEAVRSELGIDFNLLDKRIGRTCYMGI